MPYLDIDIPIDMSEDELNDFNNRNITPDNINKIIELCDYLNIKEMKNFIIKNSKPTFDIYELNDINKEHINLPNFMTCPRTISQTSVYEMAMYGVVNWLKLYMDTVPYKFLNSTVCTIAARNGNLEFLKYVYSKSRKITKSIYIAAAAQSNNVDCLIFLLNKYISDMSGSGFYSVFNNKKYITQVLNENIIMEVLKNNHSNNAIIGNYILDYIMLKDDFELLKLFINKENKFNNITKKAVEYNKLTFLKYAIENGCIFDKDTIIQAFKYKHSDCIKYLYESNPDNFDDLDIIDYTLNYIVISTNFELFKFYFNIKNKIWDFTYKSAEYGNLECLKYAIDNGCTFNKNVFIIALKNKHSECIRYLYELNPDYLNDSDIVDSILDYIMINKDINNDFILLKYFINHSNFVSKAIKHNNPDNLRHAIENGYIINRDDIILVLEYDNRTSIISYLLDYIICNDKFDLFKLFIEKNKKAKSREITRLAIKYGNLEYLKYAIENKYEITDSYDKSHILNYIMTNNDFELFKFLINKNLNWKFTDKAAEYGNLEYLKYAIENKCEITDKTLKEAGNNGKLDCVIYLHDLGYNLYKKRDLHSNCVDYFNKHGYEWTKDDEDKYQVELDNWDIGDMGFGGPNRSGRCTVS